MRLLTVVLVGVGLLTACAQSELTPTPLVSTAVTLAPSQDATLFETGTGTISSGSGGYLFAGKTGQDLRRRALLQFDVAGAVPAGATITGVTLTLNMTRTVARATDVSLHRVDASSGEGGSLAGPRGGGEGAASLSGDATWVHRSFDTEKWDTPGGDFNAAAGATSSVEGIGTFTWESDGMGADVQGRLDDPAAASATAAAAVASAPATASATAAAAAA